MDRPLSKLALRLAAPTLGLLLATGCGPSTPAAPKALTCDNAPRRLTPAEANARPVTRLIVCAADGPALASPDGEQVTEPAADLNTQAATSAAASDPRDKLRDRLRGLEELAELEPPAAKKPAPVMETPVVPPASAMPVVETPVTPPVGPQLQPAPVAPQTAVAQTPARPVASAPQPVASAPQTTVTQAPQPAAPPATAALVPSAEPALEPVEENTVAARPLVPPSEECPQTRLPWADRPIHSAAMDAVTRQANQCTLRGYELAARGATYSARAELIRSLRLIAQALDAQNETTVHGKALAAGLRALSEADDFVPRLSRVESELNVPLLIGSHQTPVLKGGPVDDVTPMSARQRYYTYAQEQLGAAAGREPAGSLALYALGRIQPTIVSGNESDNKTADPKSVVFYRAALTVDGRNYMAANELGVLLARFGLWRDARGAFVQSLNIAPQSVTWRNLAIVHQQLGETQLAQRAQVESQTLAARERSTGMNGAAPDVDWVAPESFAKSTGTNQLDVVQNPKDKPGATPPPTRK